MIFSKAFSALSARKSSTSANVGGRPVRLNVARRMSVILSARGEGVSCFTSSVAKT